MGTQMIVAAAITHHPVGHDTRYVTELLKRTIMYVRSIKAVVLYKGCDIQYIHEMIYRTDAQSVIPTRHEETPIWCTGGMYRKEMKRNFPKELYGKRNKTETIYHIMKRLFRSEVMSKNHDMVEKELLCQVLAYNCHRMCIILLVFRSFLQNPDLDYFL